jgi:hypothetical protein
MVSVVMMVNAGMNASVVMVMMHGHTSLRVKRVAPKFRNAGTPRQAIV